VLLLKTEGRENPPPNLPLKGEGFFRTCTTLVFLASYRKKPVSYEFFPVNHEGIPKTAIDFQSVRKSIF
jgi:hypothetical protein